MTDRRTSQQLIEAAAAARRTILADRRRVGPKLQPLLAHIEAHLFDPTLSVGRMKRACGIRDNSISSEFHAAIGQPPSTYIAARRMETAARLLRDTDLEVWRLSDLLGFSSLQVFSRAFVRWGGVRPSAYRRKARRARSSSGSVAGSPQPARAPVPVPHVAVPVRGLLDAEAVETVRAHAVWEAVSRRPVAEQAEALRQAARPSAALFEVVHQAARRAGRDDRQEGVRVAELALEALPVAEPGRATPEVAALKAKAWAWVANAKSLAYDVPGTWRAFDVADQWLNETETEAAVRAEIDYKRAWAYKRQGDLDQASKVLEGAVRQGGGADDLRLRADIAMLRGGLAIERQRPEEGIGALVEVVAKIDQIEDRFVRFATVQTLASCLAYAGRFDDARRWFPLVRRSCVALDQPSLMAHVVALEGMVEVAVGNHQIAERCFLEAYDQYSESGALEQAAVAALDLAALYFEQGHNDRARDYAAGAARVLAQTRQHPQALAALDVLRGAIQGEAVTSTVVRAVRSRLDRPLPPRASS